MTGWPLVLFVLAVVGGLFLCFAVMMVWSSGPMTRAGVGTPGWNPVPVMLVVVAVSAGVAAAAWRAGHRRPR